ncbi:MAG: hypothetical protein ACI82I_001328 [Gammaproteobacteria bacterium]|jgi:hypothetical protein
MHFPFYSVDHKIGPDIHSGYEKPRVRRGKPARLQMIAASNGWPPVPLVAPATVARLGPTLYIVPLPEHGLRVMIARWLIRTGQRMILPG